MSLSIPAESLQYVKVPIAAEKNGAAVNPTVDTVKLAFPAVGADPVTWYDGSWESAAETETFSARCLVGPGGTVELPNGFYDIYVQIQDIPEVPVVKATDTLEIF